MTSRPARLNVKTCISNDNFLLGSRRVKHLPLYTGRLFHLYMLDESICHFRGILSFLF